MLALSVRVGLHLHMAPYAKPYLTLDQQVALLVSRGMTITDVGKAKACLARIGYYRLSAYWYPFRKSQTVVDATSGRSTTTVLDDFKGDTDFPTIHGLYIFDKNLRLLVLDALERIEVAVRTDIALLLGRKDPWAHRNPRLLHGNFARRPKPGSANTRHQEWLNRQDKKFLDSREDFAKHFKTKYAGVHPPIWIDVELWDFGSLSHLFGGLTIADQDQIATAYGLPSGQILKTWLHCLNDVRNVCAHHSRLWNKPLVNQPTWPATGVTPMLDHVTVTPISPTRLYAALVILNWMLRVINPTSSWRTRLIAHADTMPVSKYLSLNSAGFPFTWKAEAIWL